MRTSDNILMIMVDILDSAGARCCDGVMVQIMIMGVDLMVTSVTPHLI